MDSKKGLVSIVVPVYNAEKYIEKCVNSLCRQTYLNIEILIIDDGSTDQSRYIVNRLAKEDSRIKLICKKNGGAAAARNLGLEFSSGEYIMFVDGDDYINQFTIEKNIEYLKDKSVDWVEFPIVRVDINGNKVDNVSIGNHFIPQKDSIVYRADFVKCFLDGILSRLVCGAIYRRKSIIELRFPVGMYYEDSFYFIDVLYNTYIGVISSSGCYYYVSHSDSSQHAEIDNKRLISKMKYDLKLIDFLCEGAAKDQLNNDIFQEIYFYYCLQVAKDIPGAKHCLAQIINKIGRRGLNLKQQFKIALYKIVGYQRLKKIYSSFVSRKKLIL